MKNFSFRKIRGIVGIILVVSSLLIVFYWESYGRENYLYQDVIVLNKDVYKGDIITPDMLSYIKIEENKIIDNPVTDPNTIIGLASKHYIPKKAQLSLKYFESPDLIIDNDSFIFKVPNQWLLAFPDSIRRKDVAYFYEVSKEEIEDLSIDIDTNDTSNDGVIFSDDSINKLQGNKKPIIVCTVAYVKDASNREVVTIGEHERYNGSAKIASIEIIASLEQVNTLETAFKNGKRFIVLYREE